MAPNWVRNQDFCYFLKVASLVFLDVAQDCSYGQCLTSNRAETSKKNIYIYIWPELGRDDPVYSNVVERPLRLACYLKQKVV